jgi:hypothetical protein
MIYRCLNILFFAVERGYKPEIHTLNRAVNFEKDAL